MHRTNATVSMKTNLWECHTITGGRNYLLSLLCYEQFRLVDNPQQHQSKHTHSHIFSLFYYMRVTQRISSYCYSVVVLIFYSIHLSFLIKNLSMISSMYSQLNACICVFIWKLMDMYSKWHMRYAFYLYSPSIQKFMVGMWCTKSCNMYQ